MIHYTNLRNNSSKLSYLSHCYLGPESRTAERYASLLQSDGPEAEAEAEAEDAPSPLVVIDLKKLE